MMQGGIAHAANLSQEMNTFFWKKTVKMEGIIASWEKTNAGSKIVKVLFQTIPRKEQVKVSAQEYKKWTKIKSAKKIKNGIVCIIFVFIFLK